MSLDVVMQNEAAREVMAALHAGGPSARPLVRYLAFFRSGSRVLSWERVLRLARETLELSSDHALLAAALTETCDSLEAKRADAGWRPLTGHGYLTSVLKSVAARADHPRGPLDVSGRAAPSSRQGHTLAALESKKRGP